MRRPVRWIIVGGATALLAGIAAASSVAGTSSEPVRPSYVDTQGHIDVSKMPKRMPALDSSGRTIGYVNTSDLMSGPAGRGKDPTSLPLYADDRTDALTGKRVPLGNGIGVDQSGSTVP